MKKYFSYFSKFEIALKECSETEGWLQLLVNANDIDEVVYKQYRNLCGRIRRMLIASCHTLKENMKQRVTFGDLKNCIRNTLEPFLFQKTNRNPIVIPVILNHKDAMIRAKRKPIQ